MYPIMYLIVNSSLRNWVLALSLLLLPALAHSAVQKVWVKRLRQVQCATDQYMGVGLHYLQISAVMEGDSVRPAGLNLVRYMDRSTEGLLWKESKARELCVTAHKLMDSVQPSWFLIDDETGDLVDIQNME